MLLMQRNRPCPFFLWSAAVLLVVSSSLWAQVQVGDLILLNDNGAWCWYEDERAIIHGGKLIVGSVADSSGAGGAARDGNIEIASLDFYTGQITRFVLHEHFQADDHNSPAILVRPDGRYLALYAKHGSDSFTRYRISTNPGDPTAWEPEQTFNNGVGTTYSNLYRLSEENGGAGRLYNFNRSVGFNPNALISDDDGTTWTYGGRLLAWSRPTGDPKFTGSDGGRPYLRYTSNGIDEIHFITTEDHPRAYDNSIYHGVVRGGKVYDSFGNVVDDNLFDGLAKRPNEYTRVFDTDASPLGFAWTTAIRLDPQGHPRILFTARANQSDDTDHRFLYGRFDGTVWHVHEIAKAGAYLYARENDYTGLGTLDPRDPNILYISTTIDPRDDAPLAHYEIFKGVTGDGGATWTWMPVTENSTVDNLRPIVPPSDGPENALLWYRGVYSTYANFNVEVVALILPPQKPVFVDAVPDTDGTDGNTTIYGEKVQFGSDGNATTGRLSQDVIQGADDLWHQRTGLNVNGGAVWETDVPGEENAAPLVTTLMLPPGTYRLYGLFWNTANNAGRWDAAFRVGPTGDFTAFNRDNAIPAAEDGSDFANPVTTRDDARWLLIAPLGEFEVTGSVDIYVDAPDLSTGDDRTWYEGVAYQQVASACMEVPPVTVDALIPPGATTVTVHGILPDAESVHVYANGDLLIGSAPGSPPNTPSSLTVNVAPLAMDSRVSARQVVGGVQSCRFAPVVRVGDCAGVPPVSVQEGLVSGASAVMVTDVSPLATAVSVYANGDTRIGTAPTGGASEVLVPVTPLIAGQMISATQTVYGIEGCVPAIGQWVPLRISYIDADPADGIQGNTTIDGALVDTRKGGNATTSYSGGDANDGKWHVRSRDTVNGGEIWEAGSGENPPVLITHLQLPPGTYDLYGLFWNNGENNGIWDVQFRVGPTGDFTTFNRNNAILAAADGSDFVNPVSTRESDGQWMLIAPLGRFELTGPVDIYVNPADLLPGGDDRTWYDGVGYQVVCNDPFADIDKDRDVDQDDFGQFQRCMTSDAPGGLLPPECVCFDRDHDGRGDGDVDADDLAAFTACQSGPSIPADPDCDD